jgi:hypothetical protein
VLPGVAPAVLATLVMARSAIGLTVSVAVTGFVLAPTLVAKDPAGIVLTTCGEATEVTTTETLQLELGAMPVPTPTVNAPALAATTGVKQVLDVIGPGALTKPTGYASVNKDVKVAVVSLWVLVKVTTNKDVPPALIALGVKDFATSGELAATASKSAAEQVPPKQLVAVFVFVTVGGAEIDAVLVICVCAKTVCEAKSASALKNTNAIALVF